MKKTLLGLIFGIVLAYLFFFLRDYFTIAVRVPNNHVTVQILIETDKVIETIILTSSSSNQTIRISEIKETVIVFPNIGEGEYKICCVFQDSTEICSPSHYIEGGCSPKLKIKDNEIETLDYY